MTTEHLELCERAAYGISASFQTIVGFSQGYVDRDAKKIGEK